VGNSADPYNRATIAGRCTSTMISFMQALSAIAGASSTTQTAINSTLGKAAGQPLVAAFVSYVVAILFLTVLAVGLSFTTSPRGELFKFKRRPAWYELTGGACGVFFLFVALNVAPALGVAVFFSLLVAGQLTSSLIMDRIGFLDFKALPVGAWNVICVVFALVGAALSSWDELSHLSQPHAFVSSGGAEDLFEPAVVPRGGQPIILHSNGRSSEGGSENGGMSYTLLLASGSVFAGMLAPVQASLNTRLSSLLPHKVQGVIVSLVVSLVITTFVLLWIFSSSTAGSGQGILFSTVLENLYSRSYPWQYTGGVAISVVITCTVFIPAAIGASQFYTFLLCGELLASLLFDSLGFFGLERRPPTFLKVFAILAVILASLGQGGLIKPNDVGLGCLEAGSGAAVVPDSEDTPRSGGDSHESASSSSASNAGSNDGHRSFTTSLSKGPLPTIHERSGGAGHGSTRDDHDLESGANSTASDGPSSPTASHTGVKDSRNSNSSDE
jgi:bacterial/archaeal transporter family-2 protein